ncbi:MAG TPA: thiamine pyrophosphate-binding protein [Trebonia sp.]|jgi:benzoylformate decarboxylase|nr:thiamine pyrophosphate-binding protein [Trebonia sp.]
MTAVLHSGHRAASRRPDGGTSVTRGLLDVLAAWGARRIYCCPGSTEAAVLDALVTRDDIELVLVTHESVAVAMAEGDARSTGHPAVAYLHTNVGMANGLAHLSSAQLSRAPVLVLNGLKATTLAGRGAFTTLAHPADMVRQHVKWSHVCAAAELVADDVDRALRAAVAEPAGPVWLGLPQDLLEAEVPDPLPGPRRAAVTTLTRPAPEAVAAAASLLARARRPVLVAGGEVARRHAVGRVAALAERLGAPVFDEGRRDFLASAVPTAHPLHAGLYDPAHPAVQDADVVAFLGCRMFTEFEGGPSADLPASARLVHLHPDPLETGRLHPVDAPLTGDPALALDDLLAALPPGSPAARAPHPSAKGPGRPPAGTGRFPGHHGLGPVVEALAVAVEEADATVILDATTATVPLLRGLRTTRPGQLLSSTSGSLGWGMGSALGVALAEPGRPVAALLGDGAFQFGLPALWTAQRYQIPVTFIVLNNRTYSAVASALSRFAGAAVAQDRWPGTDIAGLDIAAVARAFGLPSEQVTGGERLARAAAVALGRRGPSVLEVITGPEHPPARDPADNSEELA